MDARGTLAAAHEARAQAERSDPLSKYRCASWAQVELVHALSLEPPVEVLWHSGNSGAKTTGGLSTTLGFLQGRDRLLDWNGRDVSMPVVQPPVHWVLGIPSYKIGGASSIAKLRELLGSWDYDESHAGGEDQVTVFTIRHRLARSRAEWSKLYVFPYEGVVPEAMRLDGWQCDEPAPQRFIDALRNRKKAGRPLRKFHTLTPIEKRAWGPIFEDFPRAHMVADGGRLRLQSSVYDNQALHLPGCDLKCANTGRCPDITAAEVAVSTSPWRLARLYGEPVDISGTCPFDVDKLIAQRDRCVAGERYGIIFERVGRFEFTTLRPFKDGELEVWIPPAELPEGDSVIVVADPSSGVKEPDKPDSQQPRNPAQIVVVSRLLRVEVARFNGYVRANDLGVLARATCNWYRRALFVPEVNGGWGETTLLGFRGTAPPDARVSLFFDYDPITGAQSREPGWNQTRTRRGLVISALQAAIEDDGIRINSRADLDSLMAVRLDEKDRYDEGSGKGSHAEAMITLGIAAHLLARPAEVLKSEPPAPRPTTMRDIIRREGQSPLKRKGRPAYDWRP
jgi:hypothetical protein